ncbi:hypothetical protein AMTRI_Chr09g14540 [Amborella trichopoda]
MPATDCQGSSAPFSIGRSILSIKRNQIAAMEGNHDHDQEELEHFQRQVTDRFLDLAASSTDSSQGSSGGHELLSLAWVSKVLDAFLCCEEEFKAVVLLTPRAHLSKPALDRLLSDFLERAVKALDVCNAVCDGAEMVHQWQRRACIASRALGGGGPIGEAQLRRAKKALADLGVAVAMAMAMEGGGAAATAGAQRNRSFGRAGSSAPSPPTTHASQRSWSVPKSWSAARQLQAMGANLTAPRAADAAATGGLAAPIYTISTVLIVTTWTMVAAFPCQDRGPQGHLPTPSRQFSWALPITGIQDQVAEEWRKHKGVAGLLLELGMVEKCGKRLTEMVEAARVPLAEEREEEIRAEAEELGRACNKLDEGLGPFQRQVREVFHRVVRSRAELLEYLSRPSEQ